MSKLQRLQFSKFERTVEVFPPLFCPLLAVAIYIRFSLLEKKFLSFDERRELEWMLDDRSWKHAVDDLFSLDTLEYHWPLNLFSYFYGQLFSIDSHTIIRFPAFVLGIAGIVLGFICLRRIFDEKTAIIFTLFLAFHQMHIRYSVAMRHYVLVYLCTLLSLYFFWLCLREDVVFDRVERGRNRAFLASVNALLLVFLPMTGLLILLEYVSIYCHGRFVKSRELGAQLVTRIELLIYALATASLYKLIHLLLIQKEYGDRPQNIPKLDGLSSAYDSLLLFFGQPLGSTTALLLLFAISVFYFGSALRKGSRNFSRIEVDRICFLLAMFVAAALIPLLFFLFSKIGIAYQWRYTSYCFIPTLMLLSYFIARIPTLFGAPLLLLLCFTSVVELFSFGAYTQEHPSKGRVIVDHFSGSDLPVFAVGATEEWTSNINSYHHFLDAKEKRKSAWKIYSADDWYSFLAHLNLISPRRFAIVKRDFGEVSGNLRAIVRNCRLETPKVRHAKGFFIVYAECDELKDVYPKLMFLSE